MARQSVLKIEIVVRVVSVTRALVSRVHAASKITTALMAQSVKASPAFLVSVGMISTAVCVRSASRVAVSALSVVKTPIVQAVIAAITVAVSRAVEQTLTVEISSQSASTARVCQRNVSETISAVQASAAITDGVSLEAVVMVMVKQVTPVRMITGVTAA